MMPGTKKSNWTKAFPKAWYVLISTFWLLTNITPLQATGQPEIWKYRTPDIVESGDPVTVTIRVEGYSGEVPEPIPFDGVLVIDQSDSMGDNDPDDKRIDAAESFVDCVANSTRLAIVTFKNDIERVQNLTSNKPLLHSKLDDLRGDEGGGTNMYDAMVEAQAILSSGALPDRERFIILLTDGKDHTGHTDTDFYDLALQAFQHTIVYFTIALGSDADLARLYMIADLTEGQSFFSPTPTQLQDLYNTICQSTSTQARTRNIVLHENVNIDGQPPVSVVPGTFSSSVTGITSTQIQQFEETGMITVSMGSLSSDEEKTITFQVTSDCLTPEAELGSQVDVAIDQSSSHVTYTYGLSNGDTPVPQAMFICQVPGDIAVEKEFDPGTMELKVTVENKWSEDLTGDRDNSLKDLTIFEQPSYYFQPNVKFIEPPADLLFPGSEADVVVWRIPVIAPKDTIELTAKLDSRVCSENYQPPIGVNAEKNTGQSILSAVFYTSPTGERKRHLIPNKMTSLSLVEECEGRHDLFVKSSYDVNEFEKDIGLSSQQMLMPKAVHPRHESYSIWVDSEFGNGLWDGVVPNIGDFIDGAEEIGKVPGQGDLFTTSAKNNIYIRLGNTGSISSETQNSGIRLSVYNYALARWLQRGATAINPIAATEAGIFHIPLAPNSITSDYIRPYRLELRDIESFVHQFDPPTGARFSGWLRTHPNIETSLINRGGLLPDDIRDVLPDPCDCAWYDVGCWAECLSGGGIRNRYDEFLEQHPNLAWGKPSIQVRIRVKVFGPELHTSNNLADEVFIVSE